MARARTKKIDNVFWGVASGTFDAIAAGNDGALNFIAVGTQPSTLLRLRGQFVTYIDGVSAPGLFVLVQAGIIKVPEGSTTTVRYSPAGDSNAPWLWYTNALIGYEEAVADAVDVAGLNMHREIIDNKAMRRIRPDEEFQFAISNTNIGGGAPAINAAYGIRVLQGF